MITQFRDKYRWLSNFVPVQIELDGIKYQSVEHAYQSAKSDDLTWKHFCSNFRTSAGDVKKESHKLVKKENWDSIKIDIMTILLKKKFIQEPYKSFLISTGDEQIQEGNNWGDTFWGIDLKSNTGENNLGKILMKIRDELKVGSIQ